MVFQNYALYPHMTVYDNMAFGLKMRKFPKADIEKRVSEAAALLGIPDLLKRKPRQLSGGQRQRVAVGRAIVRHPQLFLFDEPLSNLDAKLRVQMRVELKRLHERLETGLRTIAADTVVFGSGALRLPNTTMFAVPGCKAETALIALDLAGIAASSGSACSSGKVTASHVVKAMGAAPELAAGAVRLSLGRDTTEAEIEGFLIAWSKLVSRLSRGEKRGLAA
jgi:cysteine sulfinate desulfinase/cysteine desulfurase-like protein